MNDVLWLNLASIVSKMVVTSRTESGTKPTVPTSTPGSVLLKKFNNYGVFWSWYESFNV